jgi:hypothetical protein
LPCQWVGCTEKSPTAESLYVSLINQFRSEKMLIILRIGACLRAPRWT